MLAQNSSLPLLPDSSLDLPELMNEMAALVGVIGARNFYSMALAKLGRFLGCERQIAVRYAQFAKPQFLANYSLTAEAEETYMRELYRIDPLLHLVRTQVPGRVMTALQLRREGNDNLYFENLYHSARIYDEIVVLLPAVGGVWVALCIDREDRAFRPDEVDFIRHIYPLLENLHRLHIVSCLSAHRGGYLNDSQLAVMVVDDQGQPCFRNGIWSGKVTEAAEEIICAVSQGSGEGVHSLDELDVVHWERLGEGNALAPGGRIFVVERRSPGYLAIDSLLSQMMADYRLTPREIEILRYGLRGLSTAAIAKRLDIGAGTIRNHKHRLYSKLDVTSEREIASLVFDRIFKDQLTGA
ncbi:MAG: LuxR C-terminal-related transcriptional regulator [Parvibaculaceae bacterium]